jgi:HEPN domain-containing protein
VLAVVSSVSVVGYGYYDTNVKPWHERIVKVNGTVVEMREFVETTRTWALLAGMSYNGMISPSSPTWMQVYEMLYSGEISSYSQLAPAVAIRMEENELMRQGLEREFPDVDIAAVTSDEAVEAEIRAMLVSDNATDDEFTEQYDNLLTNLKSFELSQGDFEELFIKKLLISEELKKQLRERDYAATRNFDHAQVQALLITGSDNATQLRARWEAGEVFDTLSSDNAVSSYQRDFAADNTTVNWVPRSIKSVAFDNYTFSEDTSSGVISQMILDTDSSENYWLIKVIDRQSRPLSDDDRETLVSEAFDLWLEGAKNSEDNDIVYYLDEKGGQAKLAWALDHVTVSTT